MGMSVMKKMKCPVYQKTKKQIKILDRRFNMWKTNIVKTTRGNFEYFMKGEGPPLCVTHMYSEYNDNGNTFANPFTDHYSVYLVNLKGVAIQIQQKMILNIV